MALEELDILGALLDAVLLGQRQHLVGHVQAVSEASRADAPSREQHVDSAAAPEVEDSLALGQGCQRCRVAAAERRFHRVLGDYSDLVAAVQVRRDRAASGRAATGAALLADATGSLGVLRADRLAHGLGGRVDGHEALLTSTDVYIERQKGGQLT